MGYELIKVERQGQVEILRLNDPQALNAISKEMLDELNVEIQRVEEDPDIRVLILTGEGRAFCAGANTKRVYASIGGDTSAAARVSETPDPLRRLTPHLTHSRRTVYNLWKMSKVTIAAINGACITTGVGFSAACDLRIGSDQARIGWIFLRRGLAAEDGSLPIMIKLLGYSKAFKLAVLENIIPAQKALEMGFLDEVVSAEELLPRCMSLANQMITELPPWAARMFKRLANESQFLSYEHASLLVDEAHNFLVTQQDTQEGFKAFVEKRQPQWTGT